MSTSFARALICAFTIADAVFLLEAARAQGTGTRHLPHRGLSGADGHTQHC
jgi:hypothetical protein